MSTAPDILYHMGGAPVTGGDLFTTGSIFWVDSSTGSDTALGTKKSAPLATIDTAIGKCSANKGDVIIVFAGHSETLTSSITVDVAGVSIIGLGTGNTRPSLTANFSSAGNTINITAADVRIKNLRFVTPSESQLSAIQIAGANAIIEGNKFEGGANFLDGIVILAAGDYAIIRDNFFAVTANGPDSAIRWQAASDHVQIINNYFDGGTDTNAWDDAAIDAANSAGSDVVVTNLRIHGNTFLYGVGVDINSAGTTGFITYNNFGEGTLGSMLDPGELMCTNNFEADAKDEKAREFPTSGAS